MNKIKNVFSRMKKFFLTGGSIKIKTHKYQVALFLFALIVSGGFVFTKRIVAEKNKTAVTAVNITSKENKSETPAEPATVEQPAPAPATPDPSPTPAAKTAPSPAKKPVANTPAKPKPAPSTAPAPATPALSTAMTTAGVLDQINYQRITTGLGRVSLSPKLNSAALAKAKHMADNGYFAHTAPDGTDDFYFIGQVGYVYQAAGINLAMGDFGSSKGLVDAWMNSPGHRANILASFGREVGIGIYGKYFVMMIANPR